MLTDPYRISVLFRFINFFVLIAVVVYLFKKYGTVFLQEQIQAKQRAWEDLKSQEHAFRQRQREIKKLTAEQEELGAQLSKKIATWRHVFDTTSEQIREQREVNVKLLEQRAQTRDRQATMARVQRQVIETAIAEGEDVLRQKFSDETMGQQFTQRIIKHMESDLR